MPSSDGTLKPLPLPSRVVVDARARPGAPGRSRSAPRWPSRSPPMLLPIGLFPPGTPRLNEPMLRRKRLRYCAADGVAERNRRRAPLGDEVGRRRRRGEVLTVLSVHLPPTWQPPHRLGEQVRGPVLTCVDGSTPGRLAVLRSGPLGVRTARRTHSRSAVSAGTWVVLPGSVTVTCARSAFGRAKLLMVHGAWLMFAVVADQQAVVRVEQARGRRPAPGSRRAAPSPAPPGPETLRMFSSKSSTSSRIAE